MAVNKEIVLGSGKLYVKKMSASDTFDMATIATEDNRIGLIQGGASLEYKPETYEVKDDLCTVYKRFITAEEATFKSGVLTWDVAALNKFIPNGKLTTADGKNTLKLGGNGAREMDKFAVVFEHTKSNGKAIRVGMVGTNDAGLTLEFAADKETVIDMEVKAIGSDDSGTLVVIEEETATA